MCASLRKDGPRLPTESVLVKTSIACGQSQCPRRTPATSGPSGHLGRVEEAGQCWEPRNCRTLGITVAREHERSRVWCLRRLRQTALSHGRAGRVGDEV